MRVIAGTLRSRLLLAPKGTGTRPTSDRLRETLFNVLGPRIAGARFADLYAGSGAVGIEAHSRGAAHVHLVEREPAAIATLRANLTALKISTGVTVHERSATAFLTRLIETPPVYPLDLVFLDPPYEATDEYTNTLHLLGSTRAATILASTATIVVEHATRSPLPSTIGRLTETRTLKQGDATLSFFRLTTPADATSPTPAAS
jgi:16S rRNA (guanine966-N2)-methyltransferase